MKKHILHISLALFMVFGLITNTLAQESRPPNNPPLPPGHGQGDDQQPAPIGGGLTLLLAMGAAYGAKKVYDARKKLNG